MTKARHYWNRTCWASETAVAQHKLHHLQRNSLYCMFFWRMLVTCDICHLLRTWNHPPKKKQAVSSPGLRVQLHHVCFVPKSTPKSSILNRPTVVGYPVSLIYGNPQIVEDCSIMDIGWDDSRLKWCDGRWCELMTSFDTCIYHHMDVSIERMIYEYPNCRK